MTTTTTAATTTTMMADDEGMAPKERHLNAPMILEAYAKTKA